MLKWLSENAATIIISLIILGVCIAIIIRQIKNKKAGKTSCSCGCANCPMHGECHKAKDR